MKKSILTLAFVVLGICSAMAQKGSQSVGLHLNYATEVENVGIGAFYRYNITNALRVEPSFDYYLEKDNLSEWNANVNFHYLFDIGSDFKLYPVAGLGLTSWSVDTPAGDASENKMAVNLGCGAEFPVSDKITLGAELKYQIISNWNQFVFGLNASYSF